MWRGDGEIGQKLGRGNDRRERGDTKDRIGELGGAKTSVELVMMRTRTDNLTRDTNTRDMQNMADTMTGTRASLVEPEKFSVRRKTVFPKFMGLSTG